MDDRLENSRFERLPATDHEGLCINSRGQYMTGPSAPQGIQPNIRWDFNISYH